MERSKQAQVSLRKLALPLLKASILYGLTATIPVSAPIIIPAYYAFNSVAIGKQFLDIFRNVMKKRSEKKVRDALARTVGGLAAESGDGLSSSLGKQIVDEAKRRGIIDQIATSTKVDPKVYAQMMEGTIEDGLSKSIEKVAEFAIQNV